MYVYYATRYTRKRRIDQALQGRIGGMQITTTSGAPGAATTIRIRGGNSINAGNEPLYVIDGSIGDLSYLPTAPIYKEDGSYFSVNQVGGGTYDNPNAIRALNQDKTTNLRGMGSAYAQVTFFKSLILKSTIGFDLSRSKQNIYLSANLPSHIYNKTGGSAEIRSQYPISWQNENTVNYSKTIGKHSFSALAGFTVQQYSMEKLGTKVQGFLNDATLYHAMQTGDPATFPRFWKRHA